MFYFEAQNGINLYKSSLISDENIVHSFTTRIGGNTPLPLSSFSMGTAENPELLPYVLENRKKLCETLNLNYKNLIIPQQKHTDNIKIVSSPQDNVENCDALITDKTGLALMLLFADCVPVILYAPDKHVISVVHAGWRGTAQSILQKTLTAMKREFSVNINEIKACIGPAIGQCCYPVSEETAEKLRQTIAKQNDCDNIFTRNPDNENEDKNLINVDLKKLNEFQLRAYGVEKIDVSDSCTSCNNSLFYSYRAENVKAGRHAAIACLR